MGKPKLRPLPAILKLVESLSEDERADLRDYLRPAPKPRQKAGAAKCRLCHKTAAAAIHTVGHDRYEHPFESSIATLKSTERKPSQKRKAGREATAFSNDGPKEAVCANCQKHFNNNVHHLPSVPGHHEFVEPKPEQASATA